MLSSVIRTACRVGILVVLTVLVSSNGDAQTPKTCPDGEYVAKYYKNERAAGPPAFTRCEKRIDFDWGEQGSSAGSSSDSSGKADGLSTRQSVPRDHFSVRWEGIFQFEAGTYTFQATADDGIIVWVDGQKILDEWRVQGASNFRAIRTLTPGPHRVEVVYFQRDGGAVARLRWRK